MKKKNAALRPISAMVSQKRKKTRLSRLIFCLLAVFVVIVVFRPGKGENKDPAIRNACGFDPYTKADHFGVSAIQRPVGWNPGVATEFVEEFIGFPKPLLTLVFTKGEDTGNPTVWGEKTDAMIRFMIFPDYCQPEHEWNRLLFSGALEAGREREFRGTTWTEFADQEGTPFERMYSRQHGDYRLFSSLMIKNSQKRDEIVQEYEHFLTQVFATQSGRER